MTDEEKRKLSLKQASYQKLVAYLDHAKDHVIRVIREDTLKGDVTYLKGLQAAVRLFASRQRVLKRLYIVECTEDSVDKAAAGIELKLDNDDGSQFTTRNWTHSRGRIDCPACYTEQMDTGLKRFIRICTRCQKGFQHCNCLLWDKETEMPVNFTGLTMEQGNQYMQQSSYCLCYQCEVCGTQEINPI